MIPGEPSRTAWSAAMHRAAHQIVDNASIFVDPVAVPMTGWTAERIAQDVAEHPERRGMRIFIAARHQLAHEVVSDVMTDVARTVDDRLQVVVLGAGLDTTAYRPASTDRLHVFEVDHPATGAWKRDHVRREGIAPTVPIEYVGVDFERDSLRDALYAAGLDRTQPVVVIWLGVLVYLTRPAITAMLADLGALSTGPVDLVLDYPEPSSRLTGRAAQAHAARAERVAALGEPWLSAYLPNELARLLAGSGFELVEDLDTADWLHRYLGIPPGTLPARGAHLLHARTRG